MMRLSEAIRLGAAMKPQCFGYYSDGARTCALGAAADAVGEGYVQLFATPSVAWPKLEVAMSALPCPECGSVRGYSFSVLAHLNDEHHWTRERIADFVELHEALPVPETAHDLWLSRSEHTELLERSTLPTGVSRED